MKLFKMFVAESVQNGIEHRFETYKIYANKHLTGHRKDSFISAIDEFAEAVKTGVIYNARFKEAYSYGISRGLETIYDMIEKLYVHNESDKRPYRVLQTNSGFSGPSNIGSYVKAIKGNEKLFPELNQFLMDFKDLPTDIKHIKTLIVSGRAPAPVDPNKFVKPMASHNATKKVAGFLKEAVSSFRTQYEHSVKQQLTNEYHMLVNIKENKEIEKWYRNPASMANLLFIAKQSNGYNQKPEYTFTIKPNSGRILENLIKDTVEKVIMEFITKNTSKLSVIFDKKDDVAEHKILRTDVKNLSLVNRMYFKFTDRSEFTITSDIVYSRSSLGTPFIKLVTRFTNVTKGDGTSMSMPSEEKMIKEF